MADSAVSSRNQIDALLGQMQGRLAFLAKNGDMILASGIVLIISLLVIPLPAFLLDFLLAINIAFSVLILMVSLYIRSPLDISIFPTILLITTLFRLGLNISSTRLILSKGEAGDIIHAFGQFVVGGNYVVGVIIFIILVVINFIVIIKGSGRIAEVSARFTLDALPGKQMSIDADLNAGYIDDKEARSRREKLNRESEFFGAMDGAGKFVKGDAVAGLIITAINIVGGFAIGVAQRGLSVQQALSTYTILTIGDGLVSQIPGLLISVAAGFVVTRSASGDSLENEVSSQFTNTPRVMYVAAASMFLFGILPGFPMIPFTVLSGLAGLTAYMRTKSQEEEAREKLRQEMAAAAPPQTRPEDKPVEELLTVDLVEVELGYGLIPLVDEAQGGDLFRRISNIRRQLATELGVILPPVRVRDNLQLEPEDYVIKVRGNVVSRNKLFLDQLLAMNPGTAEGELDGMKVTEPVFGLPATWIPFIDREEAELRGFSVIESEAVLTTHLTELLRRNAYKVIDRQAVKQLVEHLKKDFPALVDDVVKENLPIGIVQKVLANLLREGVPIRDLPLILEALMDYVPVTKNAEVLTEYVRHSLSDTIRRLYQDQNGVVHGISLDQRIEEMMTSALQNSSQAVSSTLGLPPEILQKLQQSLSQSIDDSMLAGYSPVILTAATVRPYFYRMIHTSFPMVNVVSFTELPSDTEIEFIAHVSVS